MNEKRFYEEDFSSFLEELVDSWHLESKQAGITKRVIDKGYDSLSLKQKYVFNYMIQSLCIDRCTLCKDEIPWSEMFAAIDNGGYCSLCQHKIEKWEDE